MRSGAATRDPRKNAILIVEDNAAQAQLVRMTLEQKGFRCDQAATGADALAYLAQNQPLLMLLDYTLPDMNALEVVAALENEQGEVPPFIIITCIEDTRLAVSTMRSGARDFLVKDFEFLERLPAAVQRVKREIETERRLKQAELALRESEARLAKAQQIARMGSWEWDPATDRVICSDGLVQLLGLSPQAVAKATLRDLIRYLHPGDMEPVQMALLDCLRTGDPFNIDCRLVRDDGVELSVNAQGEVEPDEEGTYSSMTGTILDITERKRVEHEIQQLAYYDPLTGLPNRTLLGDRLSQAIVQANRDGRLVGVIFLDLDGFKEVNDTFGHHNGDRLLNCVARQLVEVVRETDTVARIGGDEFVIVLTAISHEEDIGDVAGKILAAVSAPVQLDKAEVVATGSVGISIFPLDGEDVQTLLKHADVAMYNAKDLGKNNYRFYSQAMNVKLVERHTLDAGMRRALLGSEFAVHYQPQIDLVSGALIGTEALARWQHPEMGMVPAATFIPLAEETGLICSIGETVLRHACLRNKQWQEQGLGRLTVSVNLSTREFRQKNLVALIGSVLEETGLEPCFLELELTEATIMVNVDEAERTLRQLKELGVLISVDGFGTGYSSLMRLRRFGIDRIKIDRSFLRDLPQSQDNAAITQAIVAMGQSLGLKVLAVGVENHEQLGFLKGLGCNEIQGYLAGRPLGEEAVTTMLARQAAAQVDVEVNYPLNDPLRFGPAYTS
ncbi:putative bifunctional diguanylate cyclase/phosphodiesterase [Geomesophilobacter sediminis]|uniref:EAL domain-containing protein n=1 Tax=Geomesophilobacter sediminis TaxID=2798584 RepID=A0A8J7INF8_9BACT|nr:EAL domain-containing protein [Geomesophilobacter sediminis]MBJ6723574.1 EAL domain-containing protein [Geomesophilobacter sediminis]